MLTAVTTEKNAYQTRKAAMRPVYRGPAVFDFNGRGDRFGRGRRK